MNQTDSLLRSRDRSVGNANPLLAASSLDYGLPRFSTFSLDHFRPAFEEALRRQKAEITEIVESARPGSWSDVVEALECSGRDLAWVASIFFNLCGTDATDEMLELADDISPQLAMSRNEIFLNTRLYELVRGAEVPEDEESQRLHAYYLRQFRRAGADLDDAEQQRLVELTAELSRLSEQFGKNLLRDTQRKAVCFNSAAELDGVSQDMIDSFRQIDETTGATQFVVPIELPTIQSLQSQLSCAESRRKLYEASRSRGQDCTVDIAVRMAQLRAERAELLGYSSHADYVIEEETAPDVDSVWALLRALSPVASANASGEYKRVADVAVELADDDERSVTAADWPYWERRLMATDLDVDESALREYFPISRVMRDGIFYAAQRLYGISVVPRPDLHGYHEDVDVWEVLDHDGAGLGLLLTDYFARESKRGGAWMSSFMDQSDLLKTKPIVVNVMNITKPREGEALLSVDEVTTMFHEWGHALHGLLSAVRYPSFSGTNVPRDFVEFPSQINENWAFDPAVISHYARHYRTGEVLPAERIDALIRAREFGQGAATAEYLGAAIIDLAWHSLSESEARAVQPTAEAVEAFEQRALVAAGLDVEHLAPRYTTGYFNHVFAGGYSAGYYSYLWAEALDADGFEWFIDAGAASSGSADTSSLAAVRAAGQRFRDLVLSRGASRDYQEAFRALRGRDSDLGPLLRRRGLSGAL